MSNQIALSISWAAYTSKNFDPIYEAHAERRGHRPVMRILHGGGTAKVLTTADDEAAVRAIIREAESRT
jgi:hypothetical protein